MSWTTGVSILLFGLSALLAFRLSVPRELRTAMMIVAASNVLFSGLGQVRDDPTLIAIGHLLDVAGAFSAVLAISIDARKRGTNDPDRG
jgi:hypothetical protein